MGAADRLHLQPVALDLTRMSLVGNQYTYRSASLQLALRFSARHTSAAAAEGPPSLRKPNGSYAEGEAKPGLKTENTRMRKNRRQTNIRQYRQEGTAEMETVCVCVLQSNLSLCFYFPRSSFFLPSSGWWSHVC